MAYHSIEEVIRKMERYCAYQERSHFQVEKKLKELEMIPEAQDYIMLHLINGNYLNEERFARIYVRGKFYHNKWGKQKIIQGLKQHKIQSLLIEKALKEISDDDYINTIKHLIEKKKFSTHNNNSYQKKQKIINFLRQKGFRYEEIIPYISTD